MSNATAALVKANQDAIENYQRAMTKVNTCKRALSSSMQGWTLCLCNPEGGKVITVAEPFKWTEKPLLYYETRLLEAEIAMYDASERLSRGRAFSEHSGRTAEQGRPSADMGRKNAGSAGREERSGDAGGTPATSERAESTAGLDTGDGEVGT